MTESTGDGNRSLRKFRWRRLVPTAGVMVAFSLLLAATTIRIADPAWLQNARVLTFDLYQRLAPRPITESPVVIVDIDEKSLAALGQWPWPRSLIGDLIDRLGANGVKVVGFDSFFPEYDRMSPAVVAETFESLDSEARKSLQALPSNESIMAEAMRKTKTVLGQVALHTPLPPNRQTTRIRTPFRAEMGGDPRPFLARYRSLVANVPELGRGRRGTRVLFDRRRVRRQGSPGSPARHCRRRNPPRPDRRDAARGVRQQHAHQPGGTRPE